MYTREDGYPVLNVLRGVMPGWIETPLYASPPAPEPTRPADGLVKKLARYSPDIHPMVAQAAAHIARTEALLEEVRGALATVIRHFDGRDAPGHMHDVAGVWDRDNTPDKAGKPCEWCAQWNAARATLAKMEAGNG
jgi:hypothetical protein